MRVDLVQLEQAIAPLFGVHGVELVALEWHQGPGHGILRVFVDRPHGDPREQDPARSVSIDQVTDVTRDVSNTLDALDLIPGAYTLEVGSPGSERPVQKRADFDRFAGYEGRIEVRDGQGGKTAFKCVLRGTQDQPDGGFAIRVDVGGKEHVVPTTKLVRARLKAFVPPPKTKPGKGPSRRQERLAERERARAVNAAQQSTRRSGGRAAHVSDDTNTQATAEAPTTTVAPSAKAER